VERLRAAQDKAQSRSHLQLENEQLQADLGKLRSDLKKVQWEMIKVSTELSKRDVRIKELETNLREQQELARHLTSRDARIFELERTNEEVHGVRRKLADAEQLIAELRTQTARLPALERRIVELESSSGVDSLEIRHSESEPPTAPRAEPPPAEAPGQEPLRLDSLRKIQGIGRAFERALHEAGIRTFDQIAAWSAQDIQQIAKMLKVSPQRILRDGWVQKAQELARRRSKPLGDGSVADS